MTGVGFEPTRDFTHTDLSRTPLSQPVAVHMKKSTTNLKVAKNITATIALLGERHSEDLKAPGSNPGGGTYFTGGWRFACSCKFRG